MLAGQKLTSDSVPGIRRYHHGPAGCPGPRAEESPTDTATEKDLFVCPQQWAKERPEGVQGLPEGISLVRWHTRTRR